MNYQANFLAALAFAIVVETAVAFLVLKKIFRIATLGPWPIAYAGLMSNCSSLPYVWFVLPALIRNYTAYVIVSEICVVLWEALFYYLYLRIDRKQATLLSLLANGASWLLGFPFLHLLA